MASRAAATAALPLLLLAACSRFAAAPAHPPAPSAQVTIEAPAASPSPSDPASPSPAPTPVPTPIPQSAFIKVPYTPQAPRGNWDPAHEEYCEAAAVLMAGAFYSGDRRPVIPADEADRRMGEIVAFERQTWPAALDLTLDRIGQTGAHFYGLKPSVAPATLDGVRREVAAGHPVILPLMTHGGPGGEKISPHYGKVSVYHVLLVTGYDAQKLYTNDAGFLQGQNWSYTWEVLQSAIDAQTPVTGQSRVMLSFS